MPGMAVVHVLRHRAIWGLLVSENGTTRRIPIYSDGTHRVAAPDAALAAVLLAVRGVFVRCDDLRVVGETFGPERVMVDEQDAPKGEA